MALTVDSILEHKMFANFAGQQVLNVTHYRVLALSAGVTTLSGFAQPLGVDFSDAFTPYQSSALTYIRSELLEVNGVDIDTFAYAPGVTGLVSGDYLPVYNAYGIRLNRTNRLTRNGQKRIAGVPEANSANGALPSAIQTALATEADALFAGDRVIVDPVDEDRSMFLRAIIWGGNDPAYPLGRFQFISGVTVNNLITTQNTRKIRTRDGV